MRRQIEPPDPNLRLVGANGSPLSLLGSIKIPIVIGKLKINPKVLVTGDIPRGMFILGNDLLGRYKLSLNYSDETFEFIGSGVSKWFYKDLTARNPDTIKPTSPPGTGVGLILDSTALPSGHTIANVSSVLNDSEESFIVKTSGTDTDETCSKGDMLNITDPTSLLEGGTPTESGVPRNVQGHCGSSVFGERGYADHIASLDSSNRSRQRSRKSDRASTIADSVRLTSAYKLNTIPSETAWPVTNPQTEIIAWDSLIDMLPFLDEVDSLTQFPHSEIVGTALEDMCLSGNSSAYGRLALADLSNNPSLIRSVGVQFWFLPCNKTELEYGILMPPALIDPDNPLYHVTNLNDESITLKKSKILGHIIITEGDEIPNGIISSVEIRPKPNFDAKYFDINPNASINDREELLAILKKYWDVFALENEDLGCTNVVKHSIKTGDALPIRQRLWTRYSTEENNIIEEQITNMLKCGVIERTNSPWASNVVLVKKKDGKIRFCTDFRKLNEVTIFDTYPLPRITDVIDSLSGSGYFSCLDLISGYWQIEMCSEDSSDLKTAFITRDGIFKYKRMPFGVKNGPQEFQGLMDSTFSDMRSELAYYMDDLTPHGPTGMIHNKRLGKTLARLREINMKINTSKCRFLYTEITLLGFVINGNGIRPDSSKVESVLKMPKPNTVTKLRSFLGMINFYRKFMPKLAFVAKPLYQMAKLEKVSLWWNNEQTSAFDKLKEMLSISPILGHFNPKLPVEVHTDACEYAIAAVLLHSVTIENAESNKRSKRETPIQYASRILKGAELRWSIPEKEAIALIFALEIFRPYLALRKFIVRTDHLALTYLQNLKNPIKTRIGRWALKLQEFDCEIIYQPGTINKVADCLSRNPFEKALDTANTLDIPTFSCLQECSNETDLKNIENHVGYDLIGLQASDEHCTEIRNHIDSESKYRIKNGIVMYEDRLVVPLALRGRIIEMYHDTTFGAHQGILKTTDKLCRKFHWPKMHNDIKLYITNCLKCKVHKPSKQAKLGKLHPINPYREIQNLKPGDFISADILGPFPLSASGKRVVIVVTDLMTRYVICGALANGSAEEVAKFLVDSFICVFGAFKILLTDNGLCFRAKLLSELGKALGFKQRFTNPYSPECNGLTERFNGTLS